MVSEAVKLAVGFLEDEFKQRETSSQEFPPEIFSSHIRSSISRYEDEMSAASERVICCCCGGFVPKENVHEIGDQDDFILQEQSRLDQCGHHKSSWVFCRFCYTAIRHWKIPKFSAANFANVTMCQFYPSALEDLTAVEDCLPVCVYAQTTCFNSLTKALRSPFQACSSTLWTCPP